MSKRNTPIRDSLPLPCSETIMEAVRAHRRAKVDMMKMKGKRASLMDEPEKYDERISVLSKLKENQRYREVVGADNDLSL